MRLWHARVTAPIAMAVLAGGLTLGLPAHAVTDSGAPSSATHGAGQDRPVFSDGRARWVARCVPGQARFKVDSASIYMWAKGDRIKGFHFKYRLVASDTDGQLQWWSNWSDNVSTPSFTPGSPRGQWMTAGALGQSFSTATAWDLEVKLKYPRSLRTAFRYKYRMTDLTPPDCGDVAIPNRPVETNPTAA